MNKIRELTIKDYNLINLFISKNQNEFSYFKDLGWNESNLNTQFLKKNNFSLGYFEEKKLLSILIGDIIKYDNKTELEIHVLFTSKDYRRKEIATKLLQHINYNKNTNYISKIFLEVADNNIKAINFYEKNNFVFFNFRHNYYKHNNEYINAKCFYKKI